MLIYHLDQKPSSENGGIIPSFTIYIITVNEGIERLFNSENQSYLENMKINYPNIKIKPLII